VVTVDGGTTATYIYDHKNRRLKKSVGSGTHYVWEGSQVLSEHCEGRWEQEVLPD
jgi:hypothetical protein